MLQRRILVIATEFHLFNSSLYVISFYVICNKKWILFCFISYSDHLTTARNRVGVKLCALIILNYITAMVRNMRTFQRLFLSTTWRKLCFLKPDYKQRLFNLHNSHNRTLSDNLISLSIQDNEGRADWSSVGENILSADSRH